MIIHGLSIQCAAHRPPRCGNVRTEDGTASEVSEVFQAVFQAKNERCASKNTANVQALRVGERETENYAVLMKVRTKDSLARGFSAVVRSKLDQTYRKSAPGAAGRAIPRAPEPAREAQHLQKYKNTQVFL